jgi:hypothetical protein
MFRVNHGEELLTAQREVAAAKAKAQRGPWGLAAGVAGVCTALDYYFFDLAGAIGGAVVGFFMGQGTIHNAKASANAEIASAEAGLQSVQEDQAEEALRPEIFSAREELKGEEDERFSRASASGNRATGS